MKGLESGKDKIQKICATLRKETLEPAKQEAREIVENAHIQASEIVEIAKKKGEALLAAAEKEMEERKRVFHASLGLACRQGIEELKQQIEKKLFNEELKVLIDKEMRDPEVIAKILNSFMKVMEEKGVEEDFAAAIPKEISPRLINELLASKVLDRLKGNSVVVSDIGGGVQVQLLGREVTIDISDSVVRELIARYIRKDLRDLVFSA